MTAYEEEVRKIGGEHRSMWGEERYELCRRYAWAIPCEEALRVIGKYGPIVEGGAGSGYWTRLLLDGGVDVVAYDKKPYMNEWVGAEWAPVQAGGAEAMSGHRDRALLLVWPPYNQSMALDHVIAHGGQTVIYVGEGWYGCTADDAFHQYMDDHFTVIEQVRIPQWYGIHDDLTVYARKL